LFNWTLLNVPGPSGGRSGRWDAAVATS